MQTKTVLEWLFRKGLLFSNELLAGQAFALLIEWRIASYSALDSTTIFARKFTESLPPYHLPQRVRVSDAFIERSQEECLVLAETARERISRDICTTLELRNVQRLLLKALPERPDLVVVLGHAVTELVTVYDIPYRDVPLIRSALYVLKEQWRYQLLEDWADAIVISLTQSCGEERLAA